LELNLRL